MSEKLHKTYSDTQVMADEVEAGVGIHDAVFGDIDEGSGPNYRSLTPGGAFVVMTKANFGLGVLAIPSVFNKLGLVPGIIAIIGIQIIYTWAALTIGPFKLRHPEVFSVADAALVFGGRWAKEVFNVIFVIFFIFCGAGALVGLSTALNAVSSHGTCTAVFIVVAAVVGFALSSIRTLNKISWIGWAGLLSIFSAIMILTVAVGLQDRPANAPQEGPWEKGFDIVGNANFVTTMGAINIILFSSASSPIYYGIISEMKDPRKFRIPTVACYLFLTTVYLIIGSVVYYYCGQHVASPALGSAGILMKKVCYGIALPGLCASLTIFNHVSAKIVFVRLLGGTKHLTRNTFTHWATWLGCTFGAMAIAYIIASAIPVFDTLLSLVGALFCPIAAIVPMILTWFHDHVRTNPNPLTRRQKMAYAFNVFILVASAFLTVAGVYAAIVDLINENSDNKPWTCNNNSGRTS